MDEIDIYIQDIKKVSEEIYLDDYPHVQYQPISIEIKATITIGRYVYHPVKIDANFTFPYDEGFIYTEQNAIKKVLEYIKGA